MIGYLRGRLVAKHPPALVVDVNGVGYELEAPMSTFYRLPATGEEVRLHTHLVVREDAHLLFGFMSNEVSSERRVETAVGRVAESMRRAKARGASLGSVMWNPSADIP